MLQEKYRSKLHSYAIYIFIATALSMAIVIFFTFQSDVIGYFSRMKEIKCYVPGVCEYCSFENGCPSDKCIERVGCGGGSEHPLGCAPERFCTYRDASLKEKYLEISQGEARRCMRNYILENQNKFEVLNIETKNFDIDFNFYNPASTCALVDNVDRKDSICWAAGLAREGEVITSFLHIGAQTCKVYPDKILEEGKWPY